MSSHTFASFNTYINLNPNKFKYLIDITKTY